MTWGQHLSALEKQAEAGVIPLALRTRPLLFEDQFHKFAWEAFQFLNLQRPVSAMTGALGAIPISELAAYLDFRGVYSFEDREEYLFLISAMDRKFLSLMAEQEKRRKK